MNPSESLVTERANDPSLPVRCDCGATVRVAIRVANGGLRHDEPPAPWAMYDGRYRCGGCVIALAEPYQPSGDREGSLAGSAVLDRDSQRIIDTQALERGREPEQEDDSLSSRSPTIPPRSPRDEVDWSPDQRQALAAIEAWADSDESHLSLTGAAGTGKTTVLRAVREILRQRGHVAWAALTGKAALRVTEAVGVPCKTLHSWVYKPPVEVRNEQEQKYELLFDQIRDDESAGSRRRFLIVDESSMISPTMFDALCRVAAQRRVRVLLVGDPYQLPPVLTREEERAHGDDYSVFAHVRGPCLTQVHRNAGEILAAATLVRERGEIPRTSGTDYTYEELPQGVQPGGSLERVLEGYLDDGEDHVIITWRNEVRASVNRAVRICRGIDSPLLPVKGEPVLICRNTYEAFDIFDNPVMNGTMLEVGWVDPDVYKSHDGYFDVRWLQSPGLARRKPRMLVSTEGKNEPMDGELPWKERVEDKPPPTTTGVVPITYGYALTAHRTQGSEYRRVTVYLERGDLANPYFCKPTRLPDGTVMRFRDRWLYSSLTRGRQRVSLVVGR